MKIKLFQIDAFTDKVFCGNPAAVCILDSWIDEEKMQKIGAENNLAETAFIVNKGNDFEIRWFTPYVEVDLCGHATLAAAYVLYKYYEYKSDKVIFHSRTSGELFVTRKNDFLTLNFPKDICEKVETPQVLIDAFGIKPLETFKGKTDYLLIFQSQKNIEDLNPDFNLIAAVGGRGVIVSAKGEQTDFVSRFFAPQVGVNEDPVTGSAHTTLAPVWSKILGKKILTAKQLSKRQGNLKCECLDDRVEITGKAIIYLIGEIEI
ncbi:MAG: PhzF family phenazine biosynthesis protein [Lutibacter sp.]|uniref:PhzF family phenazine biosynthesis protein n=1 Tax=Lutibacter sp. TaxID=1925666 RepID=UPI00299D5E8A|nr:PhzF family phenazine biosynthesis protein [Lutibacter sp.]MDX1830452.1 PhzF family phenazine biosynthesis protein [Lutibacter sp.]